MTLTESIKEFVVKRRDWRWLVAAGLLALLGSYFEGRPVIDQLKSVTVQVDKALRSVQPYEVGSVYERESQPWTGLGICAPLGEKPAHASPCDVGVVIVARVAAARVIATPAVARTVWNDAAWSGRVLFSLTLIVIVVFLLRQWRRSSADGTNDALFMTILTLAFGPIALSLFFALVLQVLILLVWIFGQTLVGAGLLAATFGGVYHVATVALAIVSSADDLEKKAELVSAEVKQRLGD